MNRVFNNLGIVFLFCTLCAPVMGTKEDCMLSEKLNLSQKTLLKKQPLPKKLTLHALGGSPLPVTATDKKTFFKFTGTFCNKSDQISTITNKFMALNKRSQAIFMGLVPFFTLPHEFSANFLTALADTPKTNTLQSRIFFDPFYLRILRPLKNFFIPCELTHPCAIKGKIIAIGEQEDDLIFAIEKPITDSKSGFIFNIQETNFFTHTGDPIGETILQKTDFEDKRLHEKLSASTMRAFSSHSKIIMNNKSTRALVCQQNILEDFDNSLIENAYLWNKYHKDKLIEKKITTEDDTTLMTSTFGLLADLEKKSFTLIDTEKSCQDIKKINSLSNVTTTTKKWVYAIGKNNIALYKNGLSINIYKKGKIAGLIEVPNGKKVERMAFSCDGSILAVVESPKNSFCLWQCKKHCETTSWEKIFTATIPHIADIVFDPENRACLVASGTNGASYISLAKKVPYRAQLSTTSSGVSKILFNREGTVFALIGLDHSIQIFDHTDTTKVPVLLQKLLPKQNAIYCGSETFVDAKFSPYEKNTLVLATEGGWVASWNFMTNKIENFLSYDGLSSAPPIKEIFILGPRHVLLWHENGSIREVFALSPTAFFVYHTLKKGVISLTLPNSTKDFYNAPSLFNAREKVNQEFEYLHLPFTIKYKRPSTIESSFELSF